MAKTNKYASLNFNEIYEKKIINKTTTINPTSIYSSSSSSLTTPNKTKTILPNSRIHGHMLVLSRPTPKPISQPSLNPAPQQHQPHTQRPITPDQTPVESDSISLRPLGRTGSGLSISPSPLTSPFRERDLSVSPKPGKFVPPHLRPGYVCKEERPGPEFCKQPLATKFRDFGGFRQGHFGNGEEGRPKSGGGGYERMRRGGGSDLADMYRPGSSDCRPASSG